MIITNELPFKFFEGIRFRKFFQTMQPRFTVSSCFTITRDCIKLYFEERGKLKSCLKNEHVCLTIDTRTFIQNINYMYLTFH